MLSETCPRKLSKCRMENRYYGPWSNRGDGVPHCWVTVLRQLIFVFSCRNYEEKYYFIRNTENFCIPMNYFVVIS